MNYRLRLVSGILMVIVPILALMTINRMSIVRQIAYERELDRLDSIGYLLVDELTENLAVNDGNEVQELIALSSHQPDIVRIDVIDQAAQVRYSSDNARVGDRKRNIDAGDIRSVTKPTFIKSFPIEVDDTKYELQIEYSLLATYEDFSNALSWALAYDLLVFAAAALISWLVSGFMEKPVREATAAAQRIAAGNFDIQLNPSTRDSYGQLQIALIKMASELKAFTHQMQERIDAATVALQEKNRRLRELDRLKTEFVAMVSHDLRTPLTSIIGFAKTMRRIAVPRDTQQEYLSIIEKEGRRLSSLIEEYLDISKIETRNFSLCPTQVDLVELMREILDTFSWGDGIEISRRFKTDACPLQADAGRLKQVFINILENAFRHGGRDVEVYLALNKNTASATVSFADDGPGIAAEDRERVFEKFYRGNPATGGSGLGLTISMAIIEAHGGRIWNEPNIKAGRGTVFHVTLPTLHRCDAR